MKQPNEVRMNEESRKTVIEEGTSLDGNIKSQRPVTVSGQLKGTLYAPSLKVTSTGAVHGQMKVEELRSEGEISGEIMAETVELSGKVTDQTVVNARSLEVRLDHPDGGLRVTFGNCELRVGEHEAQTKSAGEEVAGKDETPERDNTAEEPTPVRSGRARQD